MREAVSHESDMNLPQSKVAHKGTNDLSRTQNKNGSASNQQSYPPTDDTDEYSQFKRRKLLKDTPWQERPACKYFMDGKCNKVS